MGWIPAHSLDGLCLRVDDEGGFLCVCEEHSILNGLWVLGKALHVPLLDL